VQTTKEEIIQLPNKWVPRADQLKLWSYLETHIKGGRAVEIAHRRWGKDDIGLHFSAVSAHQRIGNYWHMLPEYSQGRKAIWEAINPRTELKRIDEAFPAAVRSAVRNTDMVIQFKSGSQWQVVGSDNYNSYVGSPPVGVVFSEWELADPKAWAYIQPILEENGGWALFISSSRGRHMWKMVDASKTKPGWFTEVVTAHDTGVFTPAQLDSILQELIDLYGPEAGRTIFNQEYLCSREGAVLGAYYARQMEQAKRDGRITKVPHRPGVEVFTAWDLGVDDSMSIWFIQPIGQAFHVIDYYENTGYGLEHYAKILRSDHRAEYVYGGHYMPHDAAQREMTSPGEIAKSREEVAEDLGIRPIMVVSRAKDINVIMQVHIPAVRNLIPICYFDEERCSRGIGCLEGYQSKFDDTSKVLGTRPMHNWCAHGADAIRTFAVGYEDIPKPIEGRSSRVFESLMSQHSGGSGGNSWSGL
jgi:hypothetical protein